MCDAHTLIHIDVPLHTHILTNTQVYGHTRRHVNTHTAYVYIWGPKDHVDTRPRVHNRHTQRPQTLTQRHTNTNTHVNSHDTLTLGVLHKYIDSHRIHTPTSSHRTTVVTLTRFPLRLGPILHRSPVKCPVEKPLGLVLADCGDGEGRTNEWEEVQREGRRSEVRRVKSLGP